MSNPSRNTVLPFRHPATKTPEHFSRQMFPPKWTWSAQGDGIPAQCPLSVGRACPFIHPRKQEVSGVVLTSSTAHSLGHNSTGPETCRIYPDLCHFHENTCLITVRWVTLQPSCSQALSASWISRNIPCWLFEISVPSPHLAPRLWWGGASPFPSGSFRKKKTHTRARILWPPSQMLAPPIWALFPRKRE